VLFYNGKTALGKICRSKDGFGYAQPQGFGFAQSPDFGYDQPQGFGFAQSPDFGYDQPAIPRHI